MAEQNQVAGNGVAPKAGSNQGTPVTPPTATNQQPTKPAQSAQPAKSAAPPATQAAAPTPPPFMIRPAARGDRYIKGLFYGAYGSGKTTLAASAADVPEMGDVIVIDAESGDMSIDDPRIDVIPTRSYRQFARIYEFMKLHCQYRDSGNTEALAKMESQLKGYPVAPAEAKKYKTVIIDSLTEVQKYCMYQLLGIKVGEQALDIEPDSPQYQEWGKSAEMVRLLVRTFRDLPINVIVVCSEAVDQDERKQYIRTPNLPGKLAKEIQGFMDIVGYLYAAPAVEGGETQRRLYLTPGRTYDAKNRIKGWAGQFIDQPSMRKLYTLAMTGKEVK